MTTGVAAQEASIAAPRLTRSAMVAWGLGTLGPVTVLSATNALLLRFLTDFYGLAAASAASIIAFSKFYDAFADIAMGVASDRTRSRWGRRRPYLVLGALLLALSILAIFAAPGFSGSGARLAYMTVVLLFYATAYTVFNVPYMAMPGEMTRSYHERSELMRWRVYAVGLAIIIASAVGPKLLDWFGGGAFAYAGMAVVFAPIVIAAGCIAFAGTASAPSTQRVASHHTLRQQIRSAAGNRPFLVLIGVKLITLMALGIQSIFPYFFQRILGVPNSVLGSYFFWQSIMYLIAPSLWLWSAKRIGKKATFLIALGIGVPTYASWAFAAQGDPIALIYLRGFVLGVSGSGIILMGQSMLPDTMEYDFLRTGLRREGIFAALYTTVEKLSGAIGVAMVGALLGAYGYIQSRGATVEQPASALWAIRFAMSWLPAFITLSGMAVLALYHLDERQLAASTQDASAQGAIDKDT